ncbi:hypothetical protein [Leeia aquatica]|uniref:DUF885 domain-containing protein n=1 Tax=Leeia aquatica TaxID=2725557 RepID=A0A847SIM1_9NEIS|nr:hypothetical protein [Leeia aquatica]NLR75732.1 hypothetical protein [Leeia aquatica]
MLDRIAEAYARLVLSTGLHDDSYVDAWVGPAEWRTQPEALDLTELQQRSATLLAELEVRPLSGLPEAEQQRQAYLHKHLIALHAHLRRLQGERFRFDEESRLLYDAVCPPLSAADFDPVLTELAQLLPGDGPLHVRAREWLSGFDIPREKLDAVFTVAMDAARERTRPYIALPEGESCKLGYVQDKVWGGYNWYLGQGHSLVEVNTDFPMPLARAIDLACHEAYPGHHVQSSLIELELVQQRGWMEYAAFPLYSPLSCLAEGAANYGILLAFPGDSRIQFEREVLCPLAGLPADDLPRYHRVLTLLDRLSYVDNWVARDWQDGLLDADGARARLQQYRVSDEARAAQRFRFIEKNGSYVINYNLGLDLVAAWVERQAGADLSLRWQALSRMLHRPLTASMMV